MENVIYKNNLKKSVKYNTILNIVLYFTIYSFIGFCFETLYGVFTKGVIESRQSFLFGPFCAIYGIGALLMIYFLSPLKQKSIIIFLGSCIIGATTEYFMSYICEILLHFKWWDYSNYPINLNGRTCLEFMVIWGFLGIVLIKFFHPKLKQTISSLEHGISKKVISLSIIFFLLFFVINIIITTIALRHLYDTISNDYAIPQNSFQTTNFSFLSNSELFSPNNLIKLFPNIRIAGTNMDNTFVDTLYNVNNPYFFKIFNTNKYNTKIDY